MDLIGPCRERIRARKAGHEDLADKRDIVLLVVVVVRVMVIEDGSIRTAEYITATRSFLKLVLVTNSPKILRRCSPSDLRTSRTRNLLSASAVKQRQSGTMKRFLSIEYRFKRCSFESFKISLRNDVEISSGKFLFKSVFFLILYKIHFEIFLIK